MLGALVRIVSDSMQRNRLRTSLTVLGIGVGIAAVICTAALGAAGTNRVQQQIDALGENFLWFRAGSRNLGGVRTGFGGVRTLTADDAVALPREVPEIAGCSPQVQGREQIINANRNWNARYQAVWPVFFDIRRRTLLAGALFSDIDQAQAARIIVLGPRVSDELFGLR